MPRGHDALMHQDTLGSAGKPFGLLPDPRFFYRSASHGSVVDLLQAAIGRRDGFVLVTGEAGSGKTTVCRAVVDGLDRRTFTSLVLDPSLSEEDLLRAILQDFGLVSRDEMKRGRLAHASARELLGTLEDFLTSLRPLGAAAVLIIDEAQDLPLETLEQISALAGPGGGKEKLLQIVLVGQPILKDLLASPLVRELNGRISTRLDLKPLTSDETSAYVSHRSRIAAGLRPATPNAQLPTPTPGSSRAGPAVQFAPAALTTVHRYSGGVPRLINMICDGALLAAQNRGVNSVTPEIVDTAAAKLELRPAGGVGSPWMRKRLILVAAGVLLAASIAAAYVTSQKRAPDGPAPEVAELSAAAPVTNVPPTVPASSGEPPAESPTAEPRLPAGPEAATATGTSFSVLVASFRQPGEATALINELRNRGLPVREIRVVTGGRGVWHQVLVGPYPDAAAAARDQERVRQIRGYADARVISG